MQHSVSFLDALGHGMADKRIDILRQIGQGGSISQAARAVCRLPFAACRVRPKRLGARARKAA